MKNHKRIIGWLSPISLFVSILNDYLLKFLETTTTDVIFNCTITSFCFSIMILIVSILSIYVDPPNKRGGTRYFLGIFFFQFLFVVIIIALQITIMAIQNNTSTYINAGFTIVITILSTLVLVWNLYL